MSTASITATARSAKTVVLPLRRRASRRPVGGRVGVMVGGVMVEVAVVVAVTLRDRRRGLIKSCSHRGGDLVQFLELEAVLLFFWFFGFFWRALAGCISGRKNIIREGGLYDY
jgi:hypothetical protein